jgi:hypothetical protein
MINAFRTLNPVNILWLGLVLIGLRVGFIIKLPDHIPFTLVEPFARLLIPVSYENIFSPINNVLIAAVLILGQSLWVNHIINSYNLLGKATFLPALMYITVSSLFIPFLILSPALICNFLVIWMVDKLLQLYADENAKATAYDLGIIVAIGTLMYFPYIYMFLAVWAGLVIFRPFNWREWVSAVVGFITIFFFLAVFYFWNDRIDQFYKIWLPLGSSFPNRIEIVNYYNYLIIIPVIVILVLAFFRLRQNFFKSYVLMRKSFQSLAFIFFIALVSFYVKANFNLSHFILCAVPASIMFAYYFLYANIRWFYETLYCLLLISIIIFQFNNF